ncbi:MAG: hypothetical protein KUG65_06935, partial [Sphingomonadaceae bacterium]|nr:hypothetical protein [Sphingomonadaceae bacterium]
MRRNLALYPVEGKPPMHQKQNYCCGSSPSVSAARFASSHAAISFKTNDLSPFSLATSYGFNRFEGP